MLFAAMILAQTYVAWLDPKSRDLTLEQKIAVIDAGGHLVASDDVSIARFGFLLTSLEVMIASAGVPR